MWVAACCKGGWLDLQVADGRALPDPPLLRLENEAGRAYLSMLHTLYLSAPAEVSRGTDAEARLLTTCSAILDRFEVRMLAEL